MTIGQATARLTPDDAPKAAQALDAGSRALGLADIGYTLRLHSPVPRGRGYGSSTADITAALYALADAAGRTLTASEAAVIAISVEPSDSTMFDELTLFDHRCGAFHETLGPAPAIAVLVLDPGGVVDTISFNQRDLAALLRPLAAQHRVAFDMLRHGVRAGDLAAVGAAATLSARLHQDILHNPLLDKALNLAAELGALGVCRAHSGTILGILLDAQRSDIPHAATHAQRALGDVATVTRHTLVGGGARSIPQPNAQGDTRVTRQPDLGHCSPR